MFSEIEDSGGSLVMESLSKRWPCNNRSVFTSGSTSLHHMKPLRPIVYANENRP